MSHTIIIVMNNARTIRALPQKGGPAQSAEGAGPNRSPAHRALSTRWGSAGAKLTAKYQSAGLTTPNA
jgi:hypothetical protein